MRAALVARAVADKGAVELDGIERQGTQGVQRRVAGAEVIHGKGETVLLKAVHGSLEDFFIFKKGALRELQFQQMPGQSVFVGQGPQFVAEAVVVEVHARDIDGHGQGTVALVQPGAQQLAGLLPDVFVQLDDEAVAFEKGHKTARRDQAPFRMSPAGQGFGSHNAPAEYFHLGLEVGYELAFGQGRVHLVLDEEFVQHPVAQLVVIKGIVGHAAALDGLEGQIGPLADFAHRGLPGHPPGRRRKRVRAGRPWRIPRCRSAAIP